VNQLTAVSLFAGVGGFDLALERSGVKVVASVEIDQKASAILAKQFPDSKLFNDIKGVTGEQLINAGFDPRNGIITGGFPCQDLSMAGKRAGLGGARSGLFWEICRLLDETKAQNFILENVPGLLSSNQGKDMAAVLEALVERGYRIGYRVLDAQYFGVPQRRRRVFIVGSLGNSGIAPEKVLAIAEGRARYLEAGRKKGENLARKITAGINKSSRKDLSNLAQTLRSGGDGGVPSSRGENLVVQDPEWWNGNDVADTLTVSSNEQRMPDKNKMQMIVFDPHRSDGVRIQDKTMNTLTAIMGTGGNNTPMVAYPMHGAMIGRKDTAGPNGSGFLGENAASYTLTASEQSRHGVAIIHNPSSFANYAEQEVIGTLRAGMPTGSEPLMQFNSAVRRLTPLECERLQGFPDEWTSGQADQHRYKQMGNAVAVPVVEWIVKRLVGQINA
jgi:DNA (cytosine-5)-methyltransferase 1